MTRRSDIHATLRRTSTTIMALLACMLATGIAWGDPPSPAPAPTTPPAPAGPPPMTSTSVRLGVSCVATGDSMRQPLVEPAAGAAPISMIFLSANFAARVSKFAAPSFNAA